MCEFHSMHVEASAGLASEAIVCHVVVCIVSDRGHERLLGAERSHRLILAHAFSCLLHGLLRVEGVLKGSPNLTLVEIGVFRLLLEHDHDLADLSTAQRSIIICSIKCFSELLAYRFFNVKRRIFIMRKITLT